MVELNETKLDPIVSTVRYEAMKLHTGSVQCIGQQQALGDGGMPLHNEKSGDLIG